MPRDKIVFSKVARLCQMYLDQYNVYMAAVATPETQRAATIAETGLGSLFQSLEKVIAPETFMQSLEAQAAKENEGV